MDKNQKYKAQYQKSQKSYLDAGRKYSQLLAEAAKADPVVLSVIDEIEKTRNSLSIYDSRFLVKFANELSKKSALNNKHKQLLSSINMARNELDIATHSLSQARSSYILSSIGIPPKKNNYSHRDLVRLVNDPSTTVAEKLALELTNFPEDVERLEKYIKDGKIHFRNGKFDAKDRSAQGFLKDLDIKIIQKVNGKIFDIAEKDIYKKYLKVRKTDNALLLIQEFGDQAHLREMERRVKLGEVSVDAAGNLVPLNNKGKRYLALLAEELKSISEKSTTASMLARNRKALERDKNFSNLSKAVGESRQRLEPHKKFVERFGGEHSYGELVSRLENAHTIRQKKVEALAAEIDTIAASYAEIKKRLLGLFSDESLDYEALLSMLAALQFLAAKELRVQTKMRDLASQYGVQSDDFEPIPGENDIFEGLQENDEFGREIQDNLANRLSVRRKYKPNMDSVLTAFVKNSPKYKEFVQVCGRQKRLKEYLFDKLTSEDSLYRGMSENSHLISELVSLEVEKEEIRADLTQEFELAHKKLWLGQISKDNIRFLNKDYSDMDTVRVNAARRLNAEMVADAEKKAREIIGSYGDEHTRHSSNFRKELDSLSATVSAGSDILDTSKKLLDSYRSMKASHERSIYMLDEEIKKLEKLIDNISQNSRQEFEKILIQDIRISL